MARDEGLEARFRKQVDGWAGLSEKAMFGGLCFMLNGNMVGGARRDKDGHARFMFRVGKDAEAQALALPMTEPMIHGGRRMGGFLFADEAIDAKTLKRLVGLALAYVEGLPPK